MEFNAKPKSRRFNRIKLEGDRRPEQYPSNLQFYTIPPTENISLQEFEEFAIERLKVLKVVDTIGIRHVKGTDQYKEALNKELRTTNFKSLLFRKVEEDCLDNSTYDDRRKDHISHFILRLAYCRSEDLRRWFLTQEMDLFKFRFGNEEDVSIKRFLELNNLNYTPISKEEISQLLNHLANCSKEIKATSVESTNYYKVPFTEALDLVRSRKVFISKGSAYVPHSELVSIILSVFRSHLSHALAVTSRAVPHLEEDGRLLPMLSGLTKAYFGKDYANKKTNTGTITADMIEPLSKKAFPLCMSHLHQTLRQTHHLKHGGRMQYGLFLKGIGMNLEEALRFWRAEFTKLMDSDKFDKQYAYNIRHNYGKEGKRADYTPYSCIKIITVNAPGAGDAHGCPFRHMDSDLLRQRLQNMKISKDGVDEVMDLVKKNHYQVACGRYFEFVHNQEAHTFSPNHPNEYFDNSQRITNGVRSNDLSQSKSSRVVNNSQVSTPKSQTTVKKEMKSDDFDDFPMSLEEMEEAMMGVEECK